MEEPRVHALDYLSVIQRRKWWFVAPVVASILIGLVLLRVLPKEYKSVATLGVSSPIVSPSLVAQSTAFDNEERLRALSQQLMSPELLGRVAKEEGLGTSAAALGKLRLAISVSVPEPMAANVEQRSINAFLLSYLDPDPGRAQRVTNRLATAFIDENSKFRTLRAEDTSEFLSNQLKASQGRLADLEEQLRRAKESHMGQLPEQTQANLQTLSGLRQQIEANSTALRSEQDRLSMIERQIESVQKGNGDPVFVPRAVGDAAQTPESRVMTLQRELAAARATYTDKHPEVLRIQEELAQAKKDAAAAREQPADDRMAQLRLDPAYRQLMADREMARLRVRELESSDSNLRRQIDHNQARVEQAPMVEQQLASVQRDYDLEKQQYLDLSSKLHAASIAENVERNRRGEQFNLLYPASYPTAPTKPVPVRVMAIALLAGLCLGGGLTLLREYLDRSVHDVRDLRDEFELPVLGEVGRIEAA